MKMTKALKKERKELEAKLKETTSLEIGKEKIKTKSTTIRR